MFDLILTGESVSLLQPPSSPDHPQSLSLPRVFCSLPRSEASCLCNTFLVSSLHTLLRQGDFLFPLGFSVGDTLFCICNQHQATCTDFCVHFANLKGRPSLLPPSCDNINHRSFNKTNSLAGHGQALSKHVAEIHLS